MKAHKHIDFYNKSVGDVAHNAANLAA